MKKSTNLDSLVKHLQSIGNPKSVEGMKRFGITPKKAFGISIPTLRMIAREIGSNHKLAQQLWATGILEPRILAAFIDDPKKVTEKQMERWVRDFDNWAVCDAYCGNLFDKTPFAWDKAIEWSKRNEEFVKRAGYALMAELAVHDKQASDAKFIRFFPHIKRGAADERNFVKKAVNWALRQIGKRNKLLNKLAIEVATEIEELNSRSARWIASDALRGLTSPVVQKRLAKSN